jgi:FkbM family methyltransferase
VRGVDPGLIYDVGLHDAADTAYYLRNGYRVVAIDANPGLVEAAATRFGREVAEGRFIPLNVGIAEGEGTKTFWVSDARTEWSSFDTAIAGRLGPPRGVEVPLRSFESILAEHGVPLYCKIDIEGNDHLCLAGMRPDFRPAFVSVEITPRERQLASPDADTWTSPPARRVPYRPAG